MSVEIHLDTFGGCGELMRSRKYPNGHAGEAGFVSTGTLPGYEWRHPRGYSTLRYSTEAPSVSVNVLLRIRKYRNGHAGEAGFVRASGDIGT